MGGREFVAKTPPLYPPFLLCIAIVCSFSCTGTFSSSESAFVLLVVTRVGLREQLNRRTVEM